MRDRSGLISALSHYAIPKLYHPPSAAELRKDRRAPFIVTKRTGNCVFYGLPFGVPEHKRDVSEDSTMENPQDAKLPEIRQLREYQQQLGSMLAYVGPKLRRQLRAELTMLEEQINTLRSEIRSGGRNRSGQMS